MFDVSERDDVAAVTLVLPDFAGIAALSECLGTPLSEGCRVSRAGDWRVIGVSPKTWLAIGNAAATESTSALAERLGGVAYAIDQSGGYIVFRIVGSDTERMIQQGVFIDLDASTFAPGTAASVVIAHINVTMWRPSDDEFQIAVPRSFVPAFRHWLARARATLP